MIYRRFYKKTKLMGINYLKSSIIIKSLMIIFKNIMVDRWFMLVIYFYLNYQIFIKIQKFKI